MEQRLVVQKLRYSVTYVQKLGEFIAFDTISVTIRNRAAGLREARKMDASQNK
jgi:hypothetical protein